MWPSLGDEDRGPESARTPEPRLRAATRSTGRATRPPGGLSPGNPCKPWGPRAPSGHLSPFEDQAPQPLRRAGGTWASPPAVGVWWAGSRRASRPRVKGCGRWGRPPGHPATLGDRRGCPREEDIAQAAGRHQDSTGLPELFFCWLTVSAGSWVSSGVTCVFLLFSSHGTFFSETPMPGRHRAPPTKARCS